ncbi:MAG: hypothetical protein KatS3mg121_1510 [Gammaproteobacteria bacterium]|nr:MAG: hypothetical protein KatS3mg121_1510 [Gammaproteobacteria bacterium]
MPRAATAQRAGRILVFAKAPVPGRVKTRLAPRLSPAACAALHTRLIDHSLAQAVAARIGPVELWSDAPDHPEMTALARRHGAVLRRQRGADLGARMADALQRVLNEGASFALLIGSDCPALDAAVLASAAGALREREWVFVPTEDGGYALVGCRRMQAALFQAIDWGTERVMAQTRARLASLGLGARELPPLWDVDRPADLERLAALGFPPPA